MASTQTASNRDAGRFAVIKTADAAAVTRAMHARTTTSDNALGMMALRRSLSVSRITNTILHGAVRPLPR